MDTFEADLDEPRPRMRTRRPKPRNSGWTVLLIVGGVVASGLVFLIGGLVVLVLVFGDSPHGKRIGLKSESELYYTKAVTDDEARKLADFLESDELGPTSREGVKATFQLNKVGDRYEFRAVVKPEAVEDQRAMLAFRLWAVVMSKKVFAGAPVDVHLCDDRLNTVKVLEYK
ncbi:MAG TPA: hypothetical protein VKE74_04625 [Gemmataceae bacterium]|nr:hypothetical protein [Gemmataceae bacterium]